MVHKSQQLQRNHEQSQVEPNECWIDSDEQQEYWPATKQCIHWNRKRNYFTWIYLFFSSLDSGVNKYCHRRIVSHTTSFKHILFSNLADRHSFLLRSWSLSLSPISVCINLYIIFFRLKIFTIRFSLEQITILSLEVLAKPSVLNNFFLWYERGIINVNINLDEEEKHLLDHLM